MKSSVYKLIKHFPGSCSARVTSTAWTSTPPPGWTTCAPTSANPTPSCARLLRLVWVQDDDLEDKELKAAVVGGPVSVAIEGGTEHDFYKGGVFSDENPKCGDNIDHAVTIVGFTPDIWIIKNSYGTTWGEGGYMRWDRSIANMCGIAELPCYPLIKRKLSHSDEFEEEEEELY